LVLAMDGLFRENGVNTDVEMALFRADRGIEIAVTVADARAALAVRPGIHAWDALAWALYKAGRYDEALAASDQALRLGTRDPLMRYHAGMIALALGQTERAAAELRLAVSPNPAFSVRYGAEAVRVLGELGGAAAASEPGTVAEAGTHDLPSPQPSPARGEGADRGNSPVVIDHAG
ncbi:MAG: tetratricopeptide repeat protein, partial [Dehalococcoidia bacterium]